jgi:glycosyltransferase involved in cell wall biosynthesis
MILIDALYINKGGGKVLLKHFIENLSKYNNNDVYFLLDNRLENEFKNIEVNSFFLEGSIIKRHLFYKKFKNKLKTVFAFANIPPTIRLECKVITFFQNVILIDSFSNSILLELKKIVFYKFLKNTDFWIVQSGHVKKILENKIRNNEKILVLPFFNSNIHFNNSEKKNIDKNRIKFIYISSGESHKNHKILFNAFIKVNKLQPTYSLTVTIGSEHKSLTSMIEDLKKQNINIINLGNISKEQLYQEYLKADICIYPSLKESFGLGLIEAAQFGLPIFASNLPYVKEIITPSCVFNPLDEKSIVNVMLNYKLYFFNKVKIVAENNLNQIFDLLGIHY